MQTIPLLAFQRTLGLLRKGEKHLSEALQVSARAQRQHQRLTDKPKLNPNPVFDPAFAGEAYLPAGSFETASGQPTQETRMRLRYPT